MTHRKKSEKELQALLKLSPDVIQTNPRITFSPQILDKWSKEILNFILEINNSRPLIPSNLTEQ